MVINQELVFDLDSGSFLNGVASQPVGYSHNLRIKFIKGGEQGYKLADGSTIELFYDDTFPVDMGDPVHKIEAAGFIWNETLKVYEAGFNAVTRPLALIALSTFSTRLNVTENTTTTSFDFHTRFRNTQLPAGIDSCAPRSEQIPTNILNFFWSHFRYGLLPDQPALPAAGIDKTILAAFVATLTEKETLDLFGSYTQQVDIPENVIHVDVTPPTGISASLVSAIVIQNTGADETVLATGTFKVEGANARIFLTSPASNNNTHKLLITYAKR